MPDPSARRRAVSAPRSVRAGEDVLRGRMGSTLKVILEGCEGCCSTVMRDPGIFMIQMQQFRFC